MSAEDLAPQDAEREPSRVPGEGGIELEETAGDLQLSSLPAAVRSVVAEQTAGARRPQRYEPNDRVPKSGVYNVVDEDGRYLEHQITCHQGSWFPPATHEEILRKQEREGKVPGNYGYELEYEARHLVPEDREAGPRSRPRIYQPGEPVPISGVYNVVDRDGNYLRHQRAWVERKDTFKTTRDPAGHGYVLAYPAKHLSHD